MALIRVAGVDPSLTHTGIARGFYDTETKEITIQAVAMCVTENAAGKTVRKNSDDLRRCKEIVSFLHAETEGADVIFSEIPTGAQSARAAFSFGMVIGIMAGLVQTPGFKSSFTQVLPQEVKLSIPGGSKTTSKEEIVHWAAENWPTAGWKLDKKGKFDIPGLGRLTADNEHMADACAAIQAGVRTDDFRNLAAMIHRLSI